jgi:hypothetical protein
MRLVSYVTDRSARCGIQLGNTLYDASAVAQAAGLSFEDQSTDWSKTKEVIGRGDKIGWKMVWFGLSKRSAVAHSVYTKRIRFGESAATHGQGCFS